MEKDYCYLPGSPVRQQHAPCTFVIQLNADVKSSHSAQTKDTFRGGKKVPLYFLKALISIKLLEFPQECLTVSFMTTSRTLRRVESLKKRLISFLVQVK